MWPKIAYFGNFVTIRGYVRPKLALISKRVSKRLRLRESVECLCQFLCNLTMLHGCAWVRCEKFEYVVRLLYVGYVVRLRYVGYVVKIWVRG